MTWITDIGDRHHGSGDREAHTLEIGIRNQIVVIYHEVTIHGVRSQFACHSERSEESLFGFSAMRLN